MNRIDGGGVVGVVDEGDALVAEHARRASQRAELREELLDERVRDVEG